MSGLDRPGTPGTPRGKAAAVAATFEEEAATPSNEAGEGSPILSDLHTEEKSPTRRTEGLSQTLDAGVG